MPQHCAPLCRRRKKCWIFLVSHLCSDLSLIFCCVYTNDWSVSCRTVVTSISGDFSFFLLLNMHLFLTRDFVIVDVLLTSCIFLLFYSHGVGWAGVRCLVLSLVFSQVMFSKIGSVGVDLFTIVDTFPVTEQFWVKNSYRWLSDSLLNCLGHKLADITLLWPRLWKEFPHDLSFPQGTYNTQFLVAFYIDMAVYNHWHSSWSFY